MSQLFLETQPPKKQWKKSSIAFRVKQDPELWVWNESSYSTIRKAILSRLKVTRSNEYFLTHCQQCSKEGEPMITPNNNLVTLQILVPIEIKIGLIILATGEITVHACTITKIGGAQSFQIPIGIDPHVS